MNNTKKNHINKIALVIIIILGFLVFGSILAILFPRKASAGYMADIYQNGNLIQSIPLYQVEKAYSFELIGENNCTNVIEVRPGSIAIVSADCPDKLCVHQGAVSNSLLPITCLPNRVVIQLRSANENVSALTPGSEEKSGTADSITTDIITY